MPELNPHQFALPGMEHLAHPWAEHLSRGLMLKYEYDPHSDYNVLQGVSREGPHNEGLSATWDPGAFKPERLHQPPEAVYGELVWKGHKHKPGTKHEPGEISWVENVGGTHDMPPEVRRRSKGIAGALMRSAHHFEFGQMTKPIHSPDRTIAGEKFSRKVMPELRPVGRTGRSDKWDLPFEHPYQVKEREESLARVKSMRRPARPQKEALFYPGIGRTGQMGSRGLIG